MSNHETPITCPNCGHEYDAHLHWLVCPECGHETAAIGDDPRPEVAQSRVNSK